MGQLQISRRDTAFEGASSAALATSGLRASAVEAPSLGLTRLSDGLAAAGEWHALPGSIDRLKDRLEPTVPLVIVMTDEQKRRWESLQAPPFTAINEFSDAGTIDQKLKELAANLTQRRDRYAKLLTDATDPKMQLYYRDLFAAMVLDLNDILAAQQMPSSIDRGNAYNRIAQEAFIEIKHNVILVNGGGKDWTGLELDDLDQGLSLLPRAHTVDSDVLSIIRKVGGAVVNGGVSDGVFDPKSGEITITELAGRSPDPHRVREVIIHEVGHSHEPAKALFDEFKKLSGWQEIAPANEPRLAEFSTGDWITAATLRARGFKVEGADDQHFQISKSQGKISIFPSPPPPDPSNKFVSDYARTDPQEDFAETYTFYYLHREEMRTKFPEKFAFMEKHFGPAKGAQP